MIFLLGRLMKQSAMAFASLMVGTYPATSSLVDLTELLGKSLRMHHVAPPSTSQLGNPNAARVRPYGRQYLYLGPVGVADRHCQVAGADGILREPLLNCGPARTL